MRVLRALPKSKRRRCAGVLSRGARREWRHRRYYCRQRQNRGSNLCVHQSAREAGHLLEISRGICRRRGRGKHIIEEFAHGAAASGSLR